MGWHTCEYLTREEGEKLGLRNMDAYNSSGDVTLVFDLGRAWRMPDMARLYVELGWVPPQNFIDDVMTGAVVSAGRVQTRGMTAAKPIGYLSPATDPLPRPFQVSAKLPAGFLAKLEGHMQNATGRVQTLGIKNPPKNPGPGNSR